MSEEEIIVEGQRPRLAKLSVLSLTLSVVGLLLSTVVAYGIGRVLEARTIAQGPSTWAGFFPYIVFSTAWSISVLSLITGSITLKKIKKKQWASKRAQICTYRYHYSYDYNLLGLFDDICRHNDRYG